MHTVRSPLPLDSTIASFRLRDYSAGPPTEGGLEDAYTDAYTLLMELDTLEKQTRYIDVMAGCSADATGGRRPMGTF